MKVKWNSNFLKNSFGNCRLPPEAVLFFRSKRNGGNFLNVWYKLSSLQSLVIREIELQIVSAISFGWFADFGKKKPLPLFNGRTNWFILKNGKHPMITSLSLTPEVAKQDGENWISLPFPEVSYRKQQREIELQMASTISFGWFADFSKSFTIIQRSS